MKTFRSLKTMLGLSLALFALGAIGARGQAMDSAQFGGKFTLPFAAQWGLMTLPPGNYTLQYGTQKGGQRLVEVRGMAKGSPYGVIQARPGGVTSATRNAIVCVREGSVLIVRALEMSAIGEVVEFAVPHGTKLAAHIGKHNGFAQLDREHTKIQRVALHGNEK